MTGVALDATSFIHVSVEIRSPLVTWDGYSCTWVPLSFLLFRYEGPQPRRVVLLLGYLPLVVFDVKLRSCDTEGHEHRMASFH